MGVIKMGGNYAEYTADKQILSSFKFFFKRVQLGPSVMNLSFGFNSLTT